MATDPTAPVTVDDLRDRCDSAVAPYLKPGATARQVTDAAIEALSPFFEQANRIITHAHEDMDELERLRAELADERARTAEWRRVHAAHEELHNLADDAIARWRKRTEQAEAERDALKAAVERVRALPGRSSMGRVNDYVRIADILAALDTPDTSPETPEAREQ